MRFNLFAIVFVTGAMFLQVFQVDAQALPLALRQVLLHKLFFEKVYLHTDREYYMPGENIWFKAYLVNALDSRFTNSSNNLYVDLISPDSKLVGTEILRVTNGAGHGDFELNDTIKSGNYLLRASTHWMQNFGDNFVFEKRITILKLIGNQKKVPASVDNFDILSGLPADSLKTSRKASIRFFPEGGSLVEDVASQVAFKAESPTGNDMMVRGSVFSTAGDTVSRFESTALGVGSFIFVPQAGAKYYVKGSFSNGANFNVKLPAALPKGYVMHVSDADSAHFKVTISTNKVTMADNPEKEVMLTARHAGTRFLNGPVKFIFLQINALVSKKQFPPGISALTIYDHQLRPQCERLVDVADTLSYKCLSVNTDKSVYRPKEKVIVKIKAVDKNQKPVKANLSFAAVDANLIPADEDNIVSYLELQSEIKGPIEHPLQYFDTTNVNRFKQLDLLLLTQGWRDFLWRRLADTNFNIKNIPEKGFDFKGTLKAIKSEEPLPGVNILLTVENSGQSKQYPTVSDSVGGYKFNGIFLSGQQEVILSSFDQKKNRIGRLFLDSITNNYFLPVNKYWFKNADTARLHSFSVLAQQRRKSPGFKLSDTIRLNSVNIREKVKVTLRGGITGTPFGYRDQVFNITPKDSYYESLDNWMAHNIAGAKINDNEPGIVFLGEKLATIEPHLIVNGNEIFLEREVQSMYYNMPVNKVKKVVVKHLVGLDPNIAGVQDIYVIYLTVDPGAFNKKDDNIVDTTINGYYEARTFYKPLYENAKFLKDQDVRLTIHWEPEITTDANGNATLFYYNADPKTKIRLVLQGLTDKGEPVYVTTLYTVE